MPLEIQSLAEWERSGIPNLLSIVIPARNESGHLEGMIRNLDRTLAEAGIAHEFWAVNDASDDGTEELMVRLQREIPGFHYVNSQPPHGYGLAVRSGLANFRGDAVAIVMGDGSDFPEDIVAFYRKLEEGYDCVFGSRFVQGGRTLDYPIHKLVLNRLGNTAIRLLFAMRYNDVTNAFKMYRRRVIAGTQPLLSHHFNLTVELPLKAIVRGYSYTVVPNGWRNRAEGVSKFKVREVGSRYVFIILYCLIEKLLSRGDYRKKPDAGTELLGAGGHGPGPSEGPSC